AGDTKGANRQALSSTTTTDQSRSLCELNRDAAAPGTGQLATAGKYQTAPASVAGFAPKTQYFSHSWHLPTARYDGCHSADGYGHTGGRVWLLHLCRHHQRCSRQHQYKC